RHDRVFPLPPPYTRQPVVDCASAVSANSTPVRTANATTKPGRLIASSPRPGLEPLRGRLPPLLPERRATIATRPCQARAHRETAVESSLTGKNPLGRSAMTGAELLVRCLEREGVRYVFGVPGEETLDVNEALAHSSIRFVPVRHEQAAAFMADVWGRLTGHAGVCLATLGPGATNLATGVADANLDRAPVLASTRHLARHLLH